MARNEPPGTEESRRTRPAADESAHMPLLAGRVGIALAVFSTRATAAELRVSVMPVVADAKVDRTCRAR